MTDRNQDFNTNDQSSAKIVEELTVEGIARRFHDAYVEELAPSLGYTTRPNIRAFDPASPNGQLMQAVIARVVMPLITPPAVSPQREAGDSEFEIIASTTAKILYWLDHANVRLDSDAAQISVGLHVKRAIERAAAKEPR